MRRSLLLLVALAAVAGIVWLLASSAKEDTGAGEGKAREERGEGKGNGTFPSLRGRSKSGRLLAGADGEPAAASHPGGPHALTGRVVHADDRPWRGTVHAIWRRTVAGGTVVQGRTPSVDAAADGGFALRGLPGGPVRVVAEKPGRLRFESPEVRLPRAEPYVFVVPGGPEVAGRVVDGVTDEPVAGAVVRTWYRGSRTPVVAVTTDEEGRFALPRGVPSGEVVAEGYGTESFRYRKGGAEILVRLWRRGIVRGRVRAATDGTPVAGVTVYAAEPHAEEDVVTATSKADGTYELAHPPSEGVRLFAAGAGWIGADLLVSADADPKPPVIVSLQPGQSVERDLHVVRGIRVAGRVVDANGEPVGGADVHVDLDHAGLGRSLPESPRTRTDDAGLFAFDALPPVPNAIFYARADGYAKVRTAPIALRPHATTAIEIRFPKGALATVTVTAQDTGAPLEGATVELTSQPREGDTWIAKGVTDAEGRYVLGGVGAGELRVYARAEGYVWRRETVAMPAADVDVALVLPRPAVIEGHIVLPDGVVASQIGAWIRPAEAPGWERHHQQLRVAEDGAFRAEVPPAGTWLLSARTQWGRVRWQGETTVPANTLGVRLELEVRGADVRPPPETVGDMTVRVVGPDGAPVRSAVVSYTQWYPQGSTSRNAVAEEGSMTFRLYAKTTRLGLLVHDARGRGGARLGPAVLALEAPTPGTLDVALPLAGQLAGRVLGPDGAGVPSVDVRATPLAPAGWDEYYAIHPVTSTRSDADGRWRLEGLGDGRYVIEAFPPPGWLRPEKQTYVKLPGETRDVTLRLSRGISPVITVLDAHGAPAPGAYVHVDRRRGRHGIEELEGAWVVLADATGRVRLVGLDPLGIYGVTIEAPAGPGYEDAAHVSLVDWSPQDETIRLTEAYSIRGVVRDAAGRGLPGVHLSWRHPDGSWHATRSKDGGRFVVHQSPAPTLEVRLSAGLVAEDAREELPAATVSASEDNDVVFEPGYVLEVRVAGWKGRARWTRLTPPTRASGHVGDETVLLVGLDRDMEYAFQAGPTEGGRIAFWRGRPPPSGRLAVPLAAGRTIEGTVRLPAGADVWGVDVEIFDRGLRLRGVFFPGPRYVIRGVPEGRWQVEARVHLAGQRVSRSAVVKAGGRANFDFTRDD